MRKKIEDRKGQRKLRYLKKVEAKNKARLKERNKHGREN